MSKKFKVLYYETEEKESFVKDFIDGLDILEKAKVFSWITLLEEHGPLLPRPYADLLEDGVHELRIKVSGAQERILYFFCYKNFIILTHNFTKTTGKVPKSEIKRAKKLREDFLKRYSNKDLLEDY
jgi:phage-related protein